MALLSVGFLALHLPFRASYLVNWDAVNFALGAENFDLEHHQPHPPGYLGYVLLARILAPLVGGPSDALVVLSVVAGSLAPGAFFLLAVRFASTRWALISAILFGTAPLVWYYGVVPLSYMPAATVMLFFAGAAHRARRDRSVAHLWAAAVLLAVLGALRQTDMVLLAPLFAFAALAFPPPVRWRAAALAGTLCILWLVPLLWLAGGPARYLDASAELAVLAGDGTWLLAFDPVGLSRNLALVTVGLLVGLVGTAPFLSSLARRGSRFLAGLAPDDRRFLVLWALPAILTFLLIHTGQLGYVLLFLPVLYLVLAGSMTRTGDEPAAGARKVARGLGAGGRHLPRIAMALAVNLAVFVAVPGELSAVGHRAIEPKAGQGPAPEQALAAELLRYDVRALDRYWSSVIDTVEDYEPETTALLAVPNSSGSFRHLTYYLPEFTTYGLGYDRHGRFGLLFRGGEDGSDYTIGGLRRAQTRFQLRAGVRDVFVFDPAIRGRLPRDVSVHRHPIAGLGHLDRIIVPAGSAIAFPPSRTGPGRITIDPPRLRPSR